MSMNIGVVIIGRNEGERLRRCLHSVSNGVFQVVYVDSGSTDDSVDLARNMGSEVVMLDMTQPFTAARARNEGCRILHKLVPDVDYVQFVDGDCELVAGWLEAATSFLDSNITVAMVCGRLRERYPEHSIYNRLMDIEWDTAIGETKACGGIAMLRKAPFDAVGGYRADMIAGEESELCVRLRSKGWHIWRLDEEMAVHDSAMTHFWQWWKRTLRTGYAYAEGCYLHGTSSERHRVNESRRIWIWGLGIPVVSLVLTIWLGKSGLSILLLYPSQVLRLALCGSRSTSENWLRAIFLVLGKFPEAVGQLKFIFNRLAGKTARLIEYK